MNKMIVNSSKIEKMCSFYVSDFHLEMILVPYISEKIENKEDIKIITEKNLQDTIEVLISKMNLEEDKKQKILNLGWNKENEDIKEKSNVIVIGTEDYIKQKNEEIKVEENSPKEEKQKFEKTKKPKKILKKKWRKWSKTGKKEKRSVIEGKGRIS